MNQTIANSGKIGKRNRPPTSCEPCRTRKLKCNRASPCDTCIRLRKQCEYSDNANRNKPKQRNTGDRLQNLENLVLQFVQNGTPGQLQDERETSESTDHPGTSTTSADTLIDERGTLHDRGGQMNYVDSSHWLSILNEIKEVREQLSNSQAQEEPSIRGTSAQPEVDLVFDPMQPSNLREIIQSLPPRTVCDSLLSQYFNSQYLILPIVHPHKFQKEYELFWQDPSKSPVVWIGLLFSILGIATSIRQMSKMPTDFLGHALSPETFRTKTMQCLVLGKYSTAKAYALEALTLHLQSNVLGFADSSINLWFLMGIIIRLAMRMGYHRDSRNHSSISPFDGEMRRRLWAVIYQLDVLMSFQLGLPSMIPTDYCDTEAPRNLNFSDFNTDMSVLPPSRPSSDHTSVLYIIAKSQVLDVFRKIVAHTQSLSPLPLEKTIMLDLEMREAYNNIPQDLKVMPVNRSFMDTSTVIMKRCSIELLYLKGIIVLHRRYLNRDTLNVKYEKLRRACLDAAMDILARQADLHQVTEPGGQLCDDRWMVSSLMAHDFLLAAMVVCLELSMHMRTSNGSRNVEFEKLFDALQTSHMIWTSREPDSKEARTAAQALELMIRSVQTHNLGKSSGSVSPQKSTALSEDQNLPFAEPMMEMLDGSEDLDWTALDQYFLNSNGLPLDTYGSEEQGGNHSYSLGPDWIV